MLRKPASYYQYKRSKDLLKVKKSNDMEGKVIGYKQSDRTPVSNRIQAIMPSLYPSLLFVFIFIVFVIHCFISICYEQSHYYPVVQLPNGNQFIIGTGFNNGNHGYLSLFLSRVCSTDVIFLPTDQKTNCKKYLKIGAVVTFKYQEMTEAGIPRFPSFDRERTDVVSISIILTYSIIPSGCFL